MANLTFVDTHNMVAYLSKSDASAGFDQVMDFLNGHVIYAKRTAWNEFSYSMGYDVIYLAIVIINAQVEDLSSHNNQYTSPTLTQKVFANMRKVVAQLEQDKIAQALEILKLKKRVKKLEKKKRSKSSGLKRLRKAGGKIEAIDVDEDITLVDAETQVDMDVELQRRIDDVSDAAKEVNVVEPTVFDDEEVIMTMAQTFIKMKAKKQDALMNRWLKGCMTRK
uniref:Uncharacterized protein n=1 Tax=Tanacetum cinerariifolium TaxID=118510 RepID=A0A699LA25_TANCI|nr:hypothetical protein [Tanacetum cinerariifolium]